MSLQDNPQPFFPQSDAIVRPTGGQSQSLSHPALNARPHARQLAYNPPDHLSNGVQNLLVTHPMPLLYETFHNDQPWIPRQPMGAGSMLLIQERALNPDIPTTPPYSPSRVNPTAVHNNYHPAGVPLAMNTVEHRWVSPSAERKAKPLRHSLSLSTFSVPGYYQAPAHPRTGNHQYR
jgi:hypothetical protein